MLLSGILAACLAASIAHAKETSGVDPLTSPGNTTYYLDAQQGDDSNHGTTPRAPWKSIARINRMVFAPGDRILFAGGQTFAGALHLTRASGGAKRRPLLLSSFGKGRATIDGAAADGLLLTDCAYVRVKELNFVGCGRKNGSEGVGIGLTRTRNVELTGIEVSGFRLGGVAAGGDVNTRMTHIYAHDNGFAGIAVDAGYGDVPRSRNVYIGYCVAENNPGDPKNLDNHSGNGIVVGGADGALIEYCEAMNNGWDMPREGNGPVGIWGWNSDRLTIQHCISHDNKSPGADGGGFDFDGGVTNSVMQYNLSYNNMGCGYLLCQFGGAPLWKNNIVRYNISFNDGLKNFHSGIGLWIGGDHFSDAQIYNNTIVNTQHALGTLGDVPGMVYRNNIFLAGGSLFEGDFRQSRFENNLYWSPGNAPAYHDEPTIYQTVEAWAQAMHQEMRDGKRTALLTDPKLALPGSGQKLPTDPQRLATMPFFQLRADSPCVGAGRPIPDNGGRDLFGNRLVPNRRPDLGAHAPGQRPSPSASLSQSQERRERSQEKEAH